MTSASTAVKSWAGGPGRQAVARHALITVNAAQRKQLLDVQPGLVSDAPHDRRDGNDPAAATDDLTRDTATHLAEALDRYRPARQAAARPGGEGRLRRDNHAESGEDILERHAVDDGANGRRCGAPLA